MDRFALRIAAFNALAYILLVSIVTYGDSHIHHTVYGIRNYPLEYSVVWLSIIVFICTYKFNVNDEISFNFLNFHYNFDKDKKPFLTFLSLILPIFLLLWFNFRPEFPHMCIFQFSLGYALVIALTVHAHNYKINFNFIDDDLRDIVKIERIKLEYETWFRLIAAIVAAYWALSRNQVKLSFLLAINCLIPDIIANVVA